MAQKENSLKVNPIINALSAKQNGEGVIHIKGFVGKIEDNIVRIHQSLEMSSFVEFGKSDLLHFVDSGSDDAPSSFFVSGSSEIKVATTNTSVMRARDLYDQGGAKHCGCEGQSESQAAPAGQLTESGCYKISAEIFRDCLELGGDYRTCSRLSDRAADSCRIIFAPQVATTE